MPKSIYRFITTTIYSFLFIVTTIIMGLGTSLFRPKIFPYSWRYQILNIYSRINVYLLKYLCGMTYSIEGKENIPEKNGIVFCKHQSTWETFILQLIFKPVSFVAKKELLMVPFFGWGLAAMKPIMIKRGSGKKAVQQIIRTGTKRLEEGIWVAIFPEGTRTDPLKTGRYHIGGAMFAKKSGAQIVPVAHNAGECWPRKKFIKVPGHITVSIGKPIETAGKTAKEILHESQAWIETEMVRISRGGYIADIPNLDV